MIDVSTANVASLQPNSGPLHGGTEMTMLGTGFLNTAAMSCQFGAEEKRMVKALWKTSTWVMCITPPVAKNLGVTVEYSNNGHDFTNDGLIYTYAPSPVALELRPSTGPVQGHTRITLVGVHFVDSPHFTCKFGGVSAPAHSLTNSSFAECWVPTSSTATCMDFSASNNGLDFSGNVLHFCFIGAIEAIKIQPSFGPRKGNTVITIKGAGFLGSSADQISRWFCSFESAVGVVAKSDARILSDSLLSCQTPPQDGSCLAKVGAGLDQVSAVGAELYFMYHGAYIGASQACWQ
jgi:hypothetical protein